MTHTFTALLAAAAVALTPLWPADSQAIDRDEGELVGDFLEAFNDLRYDEELTPLAHSSELASVAQTWTEQMAADDELAHNPSLASDVGSFQRLGENVGYTTTSVGDHVDRLMNAFLDSPGHRANKLSDKWSQVGIGAVRDGNTTWVTFVFRNDDIANYTDGRQTRHAGTDRYATAARIAEDTVGTADRALLARGDDVADALAATPVAGSWDAPVLLTRTDTVPAETLSALDRLDVDQVTIAGGERAISNDVADTLRAAGYAVDRIAGDDRYATAADLATAADPDVVYLAGGGQPDPNRGWPDALSAGAAAAANDDEAVLLTRSNRLPSATAEALAAIDPSKVIIVGGERVVAADVASDVAALGLDVERVAGGDRFETNLLMLEATDDGRYDGTDTWVATGRNWPDALAAGASAGAAGESLLLVDGHDPDNNRQALRWVDQRRGTLDRVVAAGSDVVVSGDVLNRLDLQLFSR